MNNRKEPPSQIKILFVHNWLSKFVEDDLAILKKHYQVTELFIPERKNIHPLSIFRLVRNHDIVFGWFASWHTFVPVLFARILSRPAILVVGGYDVACEPEIQYGNQRGGLKKIITNMTIRMTTKLLAFSDFSRSEVNRHVQMPEEKTETLYLGVSDPFGDLALDQKKRMAITVGVVKKNNLYRKGLLDFVLAAEFLPDVEFVLAGDWEDDSIKDLQKSAPPNMIFTGWLDNAELIEYLQKAFVYLQISRHEGFGLSVAEAMLAGCIPVIARVGSLPEVVGEEGVYCSSYESKDVAAAVKEALSFSKERQMRVRARILEQFPMHKRESGLLKVIQGLIESD